MSITLLISNIIVALVSAGGFWTLIEHTFEKRKKRRDDKIDTLIKDITEMNKKLEYTEELSKAFSRDRLNHLSERYISQGYVPKGDIISYKLLGQAYVNADGNTEVKAKYQFVMDNLEVK